MKSLIAALLLTAAISVQADIGLLSTVTNGISDSIVPSINDTNFPFGGTTTNENKLPSEAAAVLHSATNVVLYSLEPLSRSTNNPFYRYKVLGTVALSGTNAVRAVAAFEAAIPAMWPGYLINCFDPRHALRITADGHTYDFLLCYECEHLYVHRDEKFMSSVHASGSSKKLDALLTAAGIPLAKH